MRRCGRLRHDPQAALDTAAVPSLAARRAAPAGVLRDPVAERSLIDFALFQQEAMADCVCQLPTRLGKHRMAASWSSFSSAMSSSSAPLPAVRQFPGTMACTAC